MTAAESKKRKVLIVSFAFPPANASGAVRVGKLAKYLPKFGWEPVVLTVGRRADRFQTLPVEIDSANIVRTRYFYLDPTLNKTYRPSNQSIASPEARAEASFRHKAVHRPLHWIASLATNVMNELPILANLLSEPTGWYFYAVKAGLEVLSKGDIDVIFSSSQPRTCHLIASRLHQKTRIPWVAEYRDLWVDPYINRSRFYQFWETKLEKGVMKGCHTLVTVSEFTVKHLETVHSKKIAVIHNGFDEQDYFGSVPLTSKFTITSTGQIGGDRRNPEPLFQAMTQLQGEGKISPGNFEVRLYGGSSLKSLIPAIEKYNLKELVKIYGFVPFKESVRRQQESTALLLPEWNNPLAKHVYTGKIFEYLGAGRPVLAIGYKTGAIDKLLQETGAGILVNEAEAIKAVLTRWLEEWRQSRKISSYWNLNPDVIRRYTRKEGARKLAQLLGGASA